MPPPAQVIHHGDTTEYIIPVSSEDYPIPFLYVLAIIAALLLLVWWRVRKKKRL